MTFIEIAAIFILYAVYVEVRKRVELSNHNSLLNALERLLAWAVMMTVLCTAASCIRPYMRPVQILEAFTVEAPLEP